MLLESAHLPFLISVSPSTMWLRWMQCDSATTYCREGLETKHMCTLVECYSVVEKTPLAVWLQPWTPLPRQTRSSGCCMTARVVTIRICLWFFVNSLLRFIWYTYINWTRKHSNLIMKPRKNLTLGDDICHFPGGKIYIDHSYKNWSN